jgi:hypothetical protein
MVLSFDLLDSMAWDVAASGVLLAEGAILFKSVATANMVELEDRGLRGGFLGRARFSVQNAKKGKCFGKSKAGAGNALFAVIG